MITIRGGTADCGWHPSFRFRARATMPVAKCGEDRRGQLILKAVQLGTNSGLVVSELCLGTMNFGQPGRGAAEEPASSDGPNRCWQGHNRPREDDPKKRAHRDGTPPYTEGGTGSIGGRTTPPVAGRQYPPRRTGTQYLCSIITRGAGGFGPPVRI